MHTTDMVDGWTFYSISLLLSVLAAFISFPGMLIDLLLFDGLGI